ncbi:Transcriptional regulator, PadR family [Candidatus Burkholderia pumila]|uniref:Transcriptional regulator, PadR family n=1 Tax=Candidatus Burkholderia pumila TaxID=1090375 RepID=A0ABR5HLG1_9BURK|nr:Transcriptional regulator, PadR family [Candidatus Burkholderia pumila]
MSSIRLFILSCFAEMGPTHGHRLRSEAERKRIVLWTDISVGAFYGAINRLEAEGLLRALGTETEGNRPPRQVYEITNRGRDVLETLQREALESVWFRYDPFDLALSRSDSADIDHLRATLSARRIALDALLNQRARITVDTHKCVGPMQEWALRHSEYRLAAELRYLDDLMDVLCPQ